MRGGTGMTRRARSLRQRATDTERALWQGLRYNRLGARFRLDQQHPPRGSPDHARADLLRVK